MADAHIRTTKFRAICSERDPTRSSVPCMRIAVCDPYGISLRRGHFASEHHCFCEAKTASRPSHLTGMTSAGGSNRLQWIKISVLFQRAKKRRNPRSNCGANVLPRSRPLALVPSMQGGCGAHARQRGCRQTALCLQLPLVRTACQDAMGS